MAVNSLSTGNNVNITKTSATYENVTFTAEISKNGNTPATADAGEAAVFEKSDDAKQVAAYANHKVDTETIEKLKADAEARNAQLKGIVEKLLLKQGGTILNSEGLASMYRNLEVDEETRAQAQKDIAEDGYWGVEQTSDRILDFAKALAGDSPELAQKMLEAVKDGFKQAEDEWGEELPELTQKTMQATLDKFKEWINGLGGATEVSTAPAESTTVKISASYTKVSESVTSIDITQ